MRIPLTVRPWFDQPAPFAFVSLRARRIRPMPFWVLVDTGSPWVAVTPHDALKLAIPTAILKTADKHPNIQFAGHIFRRLLLTGVRLGIKDETGKAITSDLPSISVLTPTKKVPLEKFRGIPSVLGNNFLNAKGLYLQFDPSRGEAFLSSE